MSNQECIFCKIANGEIPSSTVYENSDFKVILDIAPAAKGHCLIIPREHFKDIYEIDADTAGKLFSLATEVARALKQELQCDGLNIIQNNGAAAGQTVNHVHLHLIPRFEGDDVTVTWNPKESNGQELSELAKALRKRI
ncbi:MAG: HIT family protein [Lachnospiraceae bacterium]|nr:HIT family protein [Lachnospiraceae bacterium]